MPSNAPAYYRPASQETEPRILSADLVIYGATAAGIVAAVQGARLGLSVILAHPGRNIGGLTTGGLSLTDYGNRSAIGGLSREFYRHCGAHYGTDEEWTFEPHVATRVFADWLRKAGVSPLLGQYLVRASVRQARIEELEMESGLRLCGRSYLDCTYEGDLMAAAGVRFTVGRESNATYGETLNGVQVREKHQFQFAVDPYVRPGDPRSGLLFGVSPEVPGPSGSGDRRVQAYNFRMCLTQRADIRLPFPKPVDYDRRRYELLARYFAAGWTDLREIFRKFDPIRNGKTDTNNHGAISTDFIGANHDYPTADHRTRERIFQEHVSYQQGLMWFRTHDPAVPPTVREAMARWGLAGDEFGDTGGWPHQLYVREARRLVGPLTMTENHCMGRQTVDDSVGLAAYTMDSHNCCRFVHEGRVLNEGDVQARLPHPFPISYRAIVPHRRECTNLLVPVCLSASHIAYGSIRMEPVFMILAQSAVAAAAIALRRNLAVQDVPYPELRDQLAREGQILAWATAAREPATLGT